ncbi:RBBP9/YdeN family alpha/beta hydrolase [Flectobacillus major]|uniref:RBBP9/YdeN family alpha/beta hydrolase n=1 Tax=Flectobacillus major TaxID=103 RepID=UPI000406859E|nr:alpha/beta hydrolase [Flectobacillus major]
MIYSILNVPGLANSGPKHWQSIWEKQYPQSFLRVHQDNWDLPVCEDWVYQLQQTIASLTQPTLIVAHSLGCITVAHWAEKFYSPFIEGALLVAPADADRHKKNILDFIVGFNPIPTNPLPFKSVVIASTNDQYATIERAEQMARQWQSTFVNIGEKGHINANSALDDWKEGKTLLKTHFARLSFDFQ